MTLNLRKVRKAIAGLVGSAVTAGVTYLTVKVGWSPEATTGLAAALVAAVTGIVYKIPNEVTL